MPIANLQRQMREIGRIRMGIQVGQGEKRHPERSSTFRLTSPTRALIEQAAVAYGGIPAPWEDQWQVMTASDSLEILVPPGEPVSQWNELWRAGGCVRRCDSITNTITMKPCECPADVTERVALAKRGLACKATTRLAVMLPAIEAFGVWRLESHSYYAAQELAGVADILAAASAAGRLIVARLRLEQRETKRPGQARNVYAVPVIDVDGPIIAELAGLASAPRLAPGERRIPQLPATASLPPASDLRGPDPREISTEELVAGLREIGISIDEARLLVVDTYGAGYQMTGADRAAFLARLVEARR